MPPKQTPPPPPRDDFQPPPEPNSSVLNRFKQLTLWQKIAVFVVSFAVIGGIVTLLSSFAAPVNNTDIVFRSYSDLLKENQLPTPFKVVEVEMFYDAGNSPVIKLNKLSVKTGYAAATAANGLSRLELIDSSGSIIQSTAFNPPADIITTGPTKHLQQVDFSLAVPFQANATKVRVTLPSHQQIEADLSDAQFLQNTPAFEGVTSALKTPKPAKPATASTSATNNGKFSLAIVSDGYSDQNQFAADARTVIRQVSAVEPFKTLADNGQLFFSIVNNNSDLGCNKVKADTSYLLCDPARVVASVDSSQAPYDKILVLKAGSTAAASANGLSGLIAQLPSSNSQLGLTATIGLSQLLGLANANLSSGSFDSVSQQLLNDSLAAYLN